MSKYTTEVRFICEEKSGLKHSVGEVKVEDVIKNSWDKIFDSTWDTYDTSHKEELCIKILRHYYTWEIGFETAGLWKFTINQRLAEIMPYYNLMYKALSKEFPIFDTVDYTREGNEDTTGQGSTTDTQTHNDKDVLTLDTKKTDTGDTTRTDNLQMKNTGTVKDDGTSKNTSAYSDTPQGSLQNIETMSYLSSGQIDNGTQGNLRTNNLQQDNTGTQKTDHDFTIKDTGTNTTEKEGGYQLKHEIDTQDGKVYKERIHGKMGNESYARLLSEYMKAIVNIDQQVIEELTDCFMLIW